jgi:hypothetical protein
MEGNRRHREGFEPHHLLYYIELLQLPVTPVMMKMTFIED